jgi:hypothetical protein
MEQQIINASALATITREEIDIAISTAKKFPRSLSKFREDAMSMATVDVDVAASCFYKLRRNNAQGEAAYIEGPTIRLAEIVASAWGNLRYGARIIGQEDGFVIAQGIAHDLEANVSSTMEVRRRITNKKGEKFGADMIGVTSNAACAIAVRNAIFKTVPFTYAKQVYFAAKKTAIGDAKTLSERRQKMVQEFAQMSVTLEQVLEYTGKRGVEDIGLAEIEDLIGAFNAIKDGDATVDEVFRKKAQEEGPRRASEVKPAEDVKQPDPPPQDHPEPQPAAANPEANTAMPDPTPPAPKANGEKPKELMWEDTVSRVNKKPGKDGDRFGICTGSGRWVNTKDQRHFNAAQEATGKPQRFLIRAVDNGFGLDVISFDAVAGIQ